MPVADIPVHEKTIKRTKHAFCKDMLPMRGSYAVTAKEVIDEYTGTRKGEGMSALDEQVGGSHYKDLAIQPVEYIHRNGIGYMEGCAIKYLSRWRNKNGIQDLEKAKHFIELLIEIESK